LDSEEIKDLLLSDDPEARRQAVLALSGAPSREAVQSLVSAVGDPDWRVRKTAVDVLVGIGGDEVFEGLYGALFSEDNAGARNSAAEAMVKMGRRASEALAGRLDERDADVRKFIVDIIGEICDLSGAPALVRALSDPDANVRSSAIEHLGRMKAPDALEPLVEILKTEDQWLAFNAAAALGELGDKRAVGPLMEAAADRLLREAALDALGRIADESSWPVFEEALSDPVPVIREAAIRGVARIHGKSGLKEVLAASLRSRAGADELGFVRGCLEVDDAGLRRASAGLLGIVRDKDSAGALARLLLYDDCREAAFDALTEIALDGVEPLLFLLTDEDAVVRAAAAEILGTAGDARVVSFLIPLLSDENGHARSSAASALGRLGDKKAVQPLFELLRDEYEDVQEAAIHALGRMGDAELAGHLRELAQD